MSDRDAIEAEVRARAASGDHAGAATALVRGYGPEVVRFVAGILRSSDDDLAEVFAMFCEDVVRGLPGFRFASSVRTWSYALARNAASRFTRSGRRRTRRFHLPGELQEVANNVRISTLEYLRTAVKDRFAAAREELDDDERTILMLRLERQLGWREIAQVMADEELDDENLRRREQALRKRFETIKRRLKQLMEEAR